MISDHESISIYRTFVGEAAIFRDHLVKEIIKIEVFIELNSCWIKLMISEFDYIIVWFILLTPVRL